MELCKKTPNLLFLPRFCWAGAAGLRRHLVATASSAAAFALLLGMGKKMGKKREKKVKTVLNTLQTEQHCRSTVINRDPYECYYVRLYT